MDGWARWLKSGTMVVTLSHWGIGMSQLATIIPSKNLTRNASRARGWAIITSTLLIFLGLGAFAWQSMYSAFRNITERKTSYDAVIDLDMTFGLISRAQRYQRGYILTGDKALLHNYSELRFNFIKQVNELEYCRTFDLPRLYKLTALVLTMFDELETTIRLFERNGPDAAREEVSSRRGDNLLERIRGGVTTLRAEERARIDHLTWQSNKAARLTLYLIPLAGGSGFIIIMTTLYLMRNSDRQRETAWVEKERAWAERDKVQHSLEKAEKYLRTIIDLAPNAVVVSDQRGIIKIWNTLSEKTFGYAADEIIGQPAQTLIPERYREDRQLDIDRAVIDGVVLARHPLELIGLRRDGTEFPLELTFDIVHTDSEKNYFAILRDVTERRQAEFSMRALNQRLRLVNAELVRSNSELDQFAAVASHDLKSPLRQIVSYVGLLQRRYKDKLDSDALQYIAYAVEGANRMQELINDLLSYSQAGAGEHQPKPVDMNRVVEIAIRNLNGWLAENRAHIHRPSAMPIVWGDEGSLIQVFQNLLSNGIKFHRKDIDPIIDITTSPHGMGWEVRVKDNGIGMEAEHLEQIWVMFKRLNGTGFAGTGIGLSIVKKVVERHGGSIRVESEPGQGSSFFVTLPAVPT